MKRFVRSMIAVLPIIALVVILFIMEKPYPFLPALIGAILGLVASIGRHEVMRKRNRRR